MVLDPWAAVQRLVAKGSFVGGSEVSKQEKSETNTYTVDISGDISGAFVWPGRH